MNRTHLKNNTLIHCITNPISINQCANAILCIGAQPVMAEHPDEVAEITASSDALLLNLGNITDVRIKSIEISAKTASENHIPFTLDLVGISCSLLRYKFALSLLNKYIPSIIKGNYSEINALYNSEYKTSGVDAKISDTELIKEISVKLAKKYNTVILASGKTDIITDGNSITYIENGTPQLSRVTGTGCMLGALCSCYLSEYENFTAAVKACAFLGICGELSETNQGMGTFMVNLMDKLSTIEKLALTRKKEFKIENI